MAERRKRGLGRGLGALIPDAAESDRPVDVFFSGGEAEEANQGTEEAKAPRAARTDPAASMQSSRRRKPKSGTTAGSSSAKTSTKSSPEAESDSESAPSKSATANAAPAKTASKKSSSAQGAPAKTSSSKVAAAKSTSSSSSSKPGSSQAAAKKAPSGANSAEAKPVGSTSTPSKSTSSKSTGTESSATKATGAKTPSSTSAGSTTSAESSSATRTEGGSASSSPAKKPAETAGPSPSDSVPSSTPDVGTPEPDPQNHAASDAAVVEAAEPVVEARSTDLTDKRTDEVPSQSDDVSETHPGVYRSGNQIFDEARNAGGSQTDPTTAVVDADSDSSNRSAGSAEGGEADGAAPGADSEPAGVDSIPDTEFGEIDVDRIDANPRQPRTFFDEDQLSELVHSIREIGVLQPVVVRQKPSDRERFELIMGERRLRATKDAGLSTIPAIIRYVDDTDLLRDALLENLHRAELNPLEEAAAYGQLLEDFGCTQEELSERIGRSRPQISNTLRLLRLPPLVQRRVAAGVISAGHARAILGLREPEHMEVLAQRIVAEGLSVRASEEAVVLLNRGDSMNVSRASPRVAPQFIEVADRLGDRLETKVNITVGKKKGKLSVEFANQDDLNRILSLLGVESPAE